VKRSFQSFSITDLSETKSKMLSWCNRFNICAFLDNHHYRLPGHSYECLVGCGAVASVTANAGTALNELQLFLD
jgi:para-aminobenzoate synthetase component 1